MTDAGHLIVSHFGLRLAAPLFALAATGWLAASRPGWRRRWVKARLADPAIMQRGRELAEAAFIP